MPIINITVKGKVASSDTKAIVNGNSDYAVNWVLDGEWADYDTKTMRVRHYDGTVIDCIFTGCSCSLPIITETCMIEIGLFAGNLITSTPVTISCTRCIMDYEGPIKDPMPDVYAQIMERLDSLEGITPATADKLGVVKIGDNLKITEDGVLSVDTAEAVEQDNTKPVTSDAVYTSKSNIEALLGNLSELETEAKNNLVAAINEAAQSGGGGGSSIALDTTLSEAGKAADAKAVGDAIRSLSEEKVDKAGWTPDKYIGTDAGGNLIEKDAPTGGGSGTVTSVNGVSPDENGNVTVEVGQPTGEQIGTAVDKWLDEHPEATTTVEDGSITREKMAFPAYEGTLSPNLADPSKFTSARFTSANGNRQSFGETSSYAEYWRMTDYIDVSNHIGEQLWVSHWQGYCFYDDAKAVISGSGQFISGIPSVDSTDPITIPDGAVYIAIAFDTTKGHSQDKTAFMANWGNSLLSYVPYGDVVLPNESVSDAQINGKLSLDKVDTDRLILPTVGKNLVDKSQMIKHKWLNADGTTKDAAESVEYWHVNGIKVKPNTNYHVFGGLIVFFDVYGNVCGSDGGEIFTYRSIVSPVGAATCGLNGRGCDEEYPSNMIHGEFIVEGDMLPDRVLPGKYYEKAVLEDNILHDSVLHRMRDCWNPSTKTTIGLCGDSNTRGIMGNGDTTQNPNCWANLVTAEIVNKCSGERRIYPYGDIGVWGCESYNNREPQTRYAGVIKIPFYGTSIGLVWGSQSGTVDFNVTIDDGETTVTTVPNTGYTWDGLTEGYHTITLEWAASGVYTISHFVVNKTIEVINRGISGRNFDVINADLNVTGDTVDIICYGTNNRGNTNINDTSVMEMDYFEYRNRDTELIYMSPIPALDSIEEANEAWKTIPYVESFIAGREAQHNREYISLYHEIKDYCTMNNVELMSLYVDSLHLNDAGHRVVAKILCRKLGLGDLTKRI